MGAFISVNLSRSIQSAAGLKAGRYWMCLGLGSATNSVAAGFPLGESDLNFPCEKFPLRPNKKKSTKYKMYVVSKEKPEEHEWSIRTKIRKTNSNSSENMARVMFVPIQNKAVVSRL